MHHRVLWLALALAVLLAPAPLFAAGNATFSGQVEAGAAALGIDDDKTRVNEYSTIRGEEGSTAYGKVDLNARGELFAIDAEAEAFSGDNQSYGVDLDLARILRGTFSYQSFLHWLDHDRIGYIDAAIPPPPAAATGETVVLGPDVVPGFIDPATYDPATGEVVVGGQNATSQQIGRASAYGEDLLPNADFSVERREWQNEAELTIPALPNLTFHAGYRIEEREGTEQSIGMSKCTSCHVTGESREVDEQTRDISGGVTGKFGLLTVDYNYTDREFREDAAAPTRRYDPAVSPGGAYNVNHGTFDNRILYDYDQPTLAALRYDDVPDSDKETHVVKARVDLPLNAALLGSYVNSEVESRKTDEPGIFTLDRSVLKTTYDAYGLRASVRPLAGLSLTLRAKHEEVENDNPELHFEPGTLSAPGNLGGAVDPASLAVHRESVLNRDVDTLGLDGVYRLARYTTLRLGYEYEEVDREDHHFGTTETHTVKARLKARPVRGLTAWAGYTYQSIDNPFQNPDAAGFIDPATGLPYTENQDLTPTIGSGNLYGTAFYDLRASDLSNLPETVHEAKVSGTWSPMANLAATVSYRLRLEENELDRSTWEQTTHSPVATLWFAPSDKVNVNFAYNYLGQRTEAKFCQGWYDG